MCGPRSSADPGDPPQGLTLLLRVGLFSLFASLSMTTPTQGAPVIDPGSRHSYEFIKEGKTWADARSAAASKSTAAQSCHLATITSQAENDFVVAQLFGSLEKDVWIGGERRVPCVGLDNDNASNWGTWITGEPWSYTNWAPNSPDDCPDSCLKYTPGEEEAGPSHPPAWDEEECSDGTAPPGEEIWYLVECEPRNFAPALSGFAVVILSLSMLASGWWALKRSRTRGR